MSLRGDLSVQKQKCIINSHLIHTVSQLFKLKKIPNILMRSSDTKYIIPLASRAKSLNCYKYMCLLI